MRHNSPQNIDFHKTSSASTKLEATAGAHRLKTESSKL